MCTRTLSMLTLRNGEEKWFTLAKQLLDQLEDLLLKYLSTH